VSCGEIKAPHCHRFKSCFHHLLALQKLACGT
jgi:hypothetical protein